jgi:hemolysin activation/secretion protein
MKKPVKTSTRKFSMLLLPLVVSGVAYAQTAPDAGSLLRNTEKSLEQPRLPTAIPSSPQRAPVADDSAAAKVVVKQFRFKGATLLPVAELDVIVQPWIGQALSPAGLRKVADAVSEAYRARGFLARAYLPEQDLTDGRVTIAIIEGRLGSVRVDRLPETSHLDNDTVNRYILARHELNEPVRPEELQRAITLLNELPGVSASIMLEPGQREGDSAVLVSLRDTPGFSGMAQIDNTGAKSTGEDRLTLNANINSPLRIGDQIQVVTNKSQGTTYGRAAYTLPLGSDGLRVGANVSDLTYNYRITGAAYDGNAKDKGLSLSYPLLRSNNQNVALAATYDRKDFRNLVRAIEINNKSVTITNLTLSGDSLDGFQGGGITQYSLGYATGKLDLSMNATDLTADQAAGGPARQGRFQKWNWSLSRLQRISTTDALLITASGQFANRNLDSAEKFAASGPNAVRAYASTEASGDDGLLTSIEWRHQYANDLQTAVFYDTARISRDHTINTASLAPNGFSLSGVGFSVSWGKASDLLLRGVVAWRLGTNPIRSTTTGLDSDGVRRDPRVWLTALKTF